jgi:hypothetical protein
MSNTVRNVNRESIAYMRARELIREAYQYGYTKKLLLTKWREYIDALPVSLPKWVSKNARTYFNGYLDRVVEEHTCYLYTYNGDLYRRANNTSPPLSHLPTWGEIPDEHWAHLSGAIYWIYPDKKPVLFFKSATV